MVERSRERGSTLPVKFGVIFKNDQGVKTLLTKQYNDYKSKLAKFRDKDEFGLKVLITKKGKEKERIPKTSSTHRSSAGEGTSYFQRLREEEAKRSSELRKWDNIRAAIRQELSENAEQNALLNSDLPQILLNAAYLVDRRRIASFKSKVEQVRSHFEPQGLAIHLSGPWAPYSFC